MAVLTSQGMIDHARILIRDTSTTKPKLTTARMLSILNQIYHVWLTQVAPRYIEYSLGTISTGTPWLTNVTAHAEIFQVFRPLSAGTWYPPLKREKIWTIRRLLSDGRTGAPERYAITTDDQNTGIHEIFFYPNPDTTYDISGLARSEPVALVTTPSPSSPDVTPAESYVLAQVLAARCAPIVGLPMEYVNELWRDVPADAIDKMRVQLNAERPGMRPAERVA